MEVVQGTAVPSVDYPNGDSDTSAAMAGSMAEVIYPIPPALRGRGMDRLDTFLTKSIQTTVDFAVSYGQE